MCSCNWAESLTVRHFVFMRSCFYETTTNKYDHSNGPVRIMFDRMDQNRSKGKSQTASLPLFYNLNTCVAGSQFASHLWFHDPTVESRPRSWASETQYTSDRELRTLVFRVYAWHDLWCPIGIDRGSNGQNAARALLLRSPGKQKRHT